MTFLTAYERKDLFCPNIIFHVRRNILALIV